MKTIAFFNSRAGVGKTALVYHLAHMFAELNVPTLAVDLDPQANLSSMFLKDDRIESLWNGSQTITAAINPLIEGTGDVSAAHVEPIADGLHLLVGELKLSGLEDQLAESWGKCLSNDARAFRVMSAFHRVVQGAAESVGAEVALIDLGPNLGALNRAALLAADHLVIPLAPDLFSLQGLRNLGPTLRDWQSGWRTRRDEAARNRRELSFSLPEAQMTPAGYVLMSFGVRDSRPVQAYEHWMNQIPSIYRSEVLHEGHAPSITDPRDTVANDPNALAMLKHYRSLMPMAMTARKPMFSLRTADGAIGSHLEAVANCRADFDRLARRIAAKTGLAMP